MLYERWQSIAEENANRIAVFDSANQRDWTFAQLAEGVAQRDSIQGSVRFPSGHDVGFIIDVLAAWRDRIPILPLEKSQVVPIIPAIPSSIAHLKLTSGTTGLAQLIGFTVEQLSADAINIISTMGLNSETPNLGVISLAHSYGFSNLITPLLLHGIPLILCPTPLPEMVKAAASGHKSVCLPAVPAMWSAWHEADSIPDNVQIAISAGAPLPIELEHSVFEDTRLKIHNFCGSSECGGIAYDRSAPPRKEASEIGQAMDNVSLSISDEGCLVVESRAVGSGYISVPDERLRNHRFLTSDLAQLSDDGELHILGRVSDIINVAGRKLSPETVERVVRAQTGVQDCVVFGVPSDDDARCDEVVIAVELKPEATTSMVKGETASHLATWQLPRHWWLVEQIETNTRGKVSRKEWRERFLAQRSTSSPVTR